MNQQSSLLNTLQELFGDDINVSLIFSSLKKSLFWFFLILAFDIIILSLYLRYTLPVYEASSSIILKQELSTAELLGLKNVLSLTSQDDANRELQFFKSKILLERVINKLPLEVSYFIEGRTRFITSELYKESPFIVRVINVKDPSILGRDINFNFIDNQKFEIKYQSNVEFISETFAFDRPFETPMFDIEISIDSNYTDDVSKLKKNQYYFRINNLGQVADAISSSIEVKPKDSRTTIISIKNKNRVFASDIINTCVEEFRMLNKERKSEGADQVIGFLEKEIDTFKIVFENIQDSVRLFRLQNKYIDPQSQIARLSSKLIGLDEQLLELALQGKILNWFSNYIDSVKDIRLLTPGIAEGEAGASNTYIGSIKTMQQNLDEMLINYTPEHPKVKLRSKYINREREELKMNLSNIEEKNKFKIEDKASQYNKLLYELSLLPEKEEEYLRLMNKYKAVEEYYTMLLNKHAEYVLAKQSIISDYAILEKAKIPVIPVFPKKAQLWSIAIMIAVLVGLILVVARYFLHTTIIAVDEIKRKTKAVFLGVVPTVKEIAPNVNIIVNQNQKSLVSESFRAMRANLQFLNNQPGSKLIGITSSISGEGKTFISVNLSGILALLDKKVILLDFDMRRPRLNKMFKVPNEKGMSTILIGKNTYEECLNQSEIKNLHYITSGPIPPNPAELILSDRLKKLIADLKTKYDYIVFDTPPIGLVTDGMEIIRLVDYPIYVFRADYSDRAFISNLDKLINENKIHNLSFILNDIGRGVSGYYYDKSYTYSYSYGYGYGAGYYTESPKVKKDSLIVKLIKRLTK
jgi:tyrosine-protein kinase Etk/Wzc